MNMAQFLKRYKHSLWFIAIRQLRKNRIAVFSIFVIMVYIIMALFVQFGFMAKSYNEKHSAPGEISSGRIVMLFREYEPPSSEFWFGTDIFGRDVFQKTVYGVRTALMIGLVTSLIAIPIGLILGAMAGYFGGLVDEIIVWFYSAVASIPGLLLLLSLSLIFGRGLKGVYLAIGLTSWVGLCRLVRGEVLKIKNVEYVQAARALGASHFRIIFLHIIPNVFHLVIINFTLQFCYAIKSEVILSYLGIGVELGQPSWGNMIQSARQELQRGVWWQFAAATVAMLIIVLAFNLFGDALRDALDPRLKNA
jgi:peptide/nickel transport system permease protein